MRFELSKSSVGEDSRCRGLQSGIHPTPAELQVSPRTFTLQRIWKKHELSLRHHLTVALAGLGSRPK